MDAARAALRLGAKPLVIYRRTKEEMPAWEEEISEAEEEQIEFIFLSSPVKILTENGKVKGIECVKNLLGPPGKDGRREPRPIENSNFTLPVDSVISAIGEAPDLSFLPHELQKSKDAVLVDETGATAHEEGFCRRRHRGPAPDRILCHRGGKEGRHGHRCHPPGKECGRGFAPGPLGRKGQPLHGPL